MRVRREAALRRVSNYRRRPRDLIANAIEHTAFDARHRRRRPRQTRGVNNSALREICVELHGAVRRDQYAELSVAPCWSEGKRGLSATAAISVAFGRALGRLDHSRLHAQDTNRTHSRTRTISPLNARRVACLAEDTHRMFAESARVLAA
jgi:hypothetical protein